MLRVAQPARPTLTRCGSAGETGGSAVYIPLCALVRETRAHAQEIADELARVAIMGQSGSTGEYWRSGFYNGEHNGGFQLLDLINDDTPREDMREAFPKTFDAIQRSGAPFGPRLVAFGRMKPHTWLPRHSDKCNYLLTAHVPLPIPKTAFAQSARTPEALDVVGIRHALKAHSLKERARGRACPSPLTRAGLAGITVADEANAWVDSDGTTERAVVADTTYPHSAYNDGDEAAYILFIDFWHPDLTDEELRALRLFHASVGEHTSKRARVLDGVRQDLERTFAMSGAGPPGAAAV